MGSTYCWNAMRYYLAAAPMVLVAEYSAVLQALAGQLHSEPLLGLNLASSAQVYHSYQSLCLHIYLPYTSSTVFQDGHST